MRKEMIDPYISDQINLMRKYNPGRDVDEGDLPFIDELCSIGLMNKGISLKRRKITAKPTGIGLNIINELGRCVTYIEPHHPVVKHPVVTIETLEVVPIKHVVTEEPVVAKEHPQHKTSERFENIIT